MIRVPPAGFYTQQVVYRRVCLSVLVDHRCLEQELALADDLSRIKASTGVLASPEASFSRSSCAKIPICLLNGDFLQAVRACVVASATATSFDGGKVEERKNRSLKYCL